MPTGSCWSQTGLANTHVPAVSVGVTVPTRGNTRPDGAGTNCGPIHVRTVTGCASAPARLTSGMKYSVALNRGPRSSHAEIPAVVGTFAPATHG